MLIISGEVTSVHFLVAPRTEEEKRSKILKVIDFQDFLFNGITSKVQELAVYRTFIVANSYAFYLSRKKANETVSNVLNC